MFYQDYEKIRLIGKGSFAAVYKVRHASLGYVRALKVCSEEIEDENDRSWQTFLNECKVLLRIGNGGHPNIVRIYQPRLLNNRAIVEMDCVEGISLRKHLDSIGCMTIHEFKKFARQIVGAMAYCHHDIYQFLMNPAEDGLKSDPNDGRKYLITPEIKTKLVKEYAVVHNDLHSGNIMRRDYDGNFVLLDFGLAIQEGHCVKSSSRFDGAIEYCSPEKLENDLISPRSDVYALGILLYEALAGRVPFPYDTSGGKAPESERSRVYQQHLHETPGAIFSLRKKHMEEMNSGQKYEQDYPEELEEVIMQCLAKNPEQRYSDAKQLLSALEKVFEGMSPLTVIEKEKEALAIELSNAVVKNSQLNQDFQQLEQRSQELNRTNQELTNSNRQLKESNLQLQESRLQLEDTVQQLKDSNLQLRSTLEDSNKSCEESKTKLEELHQQLMDKEERFKSMGGENSSDSHKNNSRWKITTIILGILLLGFIIYWLFIGYYPLGHSKTPDNKPITLVDTILVQGEPTVVERTISDTVTVVRRDTVRVEVPVTKTQTKVEYRDNPSTQRELNRLRQENKKLNDQLERWKQTLPK